MGWISSHWPTIWSKYPNSCSKFLLLQKEEFKAEANIHCTSESEIDFKKRDSEHMFACEWERYPMTSGSESPMKRDREEVSGEPINKSKSLLISLHV